MKLPQLTSTSETSITNIITPEFINTVIELFAIGKSETQVSAYLKMSKQKFKSLYTSFEGLELKKAVEYGKTLHESFFEDLVQNAMTGKMFACKEGLIKAYMQNKFNWNEKTEVIDKGSTSNLSDEELQEQINKVKDNAE